MIKRNNDPFTYSKPKKFEAKVLSTREVVSFLKSQGYKLDVDSVKHLIRYGHIEDPKKIQAAWIWSKGNINELRKHLDKKKRKK